MLKIINFVMLFKGLNYYNYDICEIEWNLSFGFYKSYEMIYYNF